MTSPSPRSSTSRWLDLAFVPLLLAVYMAATFAPAPAWLARVPLSAIPGGQADVSSAKLILATLLFVTGLRTALPAWPRAPLSSAGFLALGAAGRLIPLAAMIALTHLLVAAAAPAEGLDIATGLLLVAAMPSANTSTAWTRRAGGSLALCVGVVLLTTVAAPLVVPAATALAAGPAATMASSGGRAFAGIGLELLAWIVIPMAVGMAVGRLAGCREGVPLGLAGSVGSLAAILALNYLNASRGLPQLLGGGHLATLAGAAGAGAILVAATYGTAGLIGRRCNATPEAKLALAYAMGMSNTGLAGALASEAFPDRAVILYPIVLCTLAQHVIAAVIDAAGREQAFPGTPPPRGAGR